MPHSENPWRLEWITYRPACRHEHLADPDERLIYVVCPDAHPDGSREASA